MISQYYRWMFEKKKDESVLSLREWVIQESEFQTIATEIFHGLSSGNTRKSKHRDGGRTYFNRNSVQKCNLCNGQHPIWRCTQFKQMTVSERWNFAKQSCLCYRCLGESHMGSKCNNSRCCGVNGCTKTHNRLLHDNQRQEIKQPSYQGNRASVSTQTPSIMEEETAVGTERSLTTRDKAKTSQRQEFLAMRTVPVTLVNGNRRIKVNALLDDASRKTYINADVAAELGLQGSFQKTNVNVLNCQVETFLTMPVEFKLESLDGKVNTKIAAYTTEKVTSDMKVVNWNKHATKWKHLENIQFPVIASKPLVDILIGLDFNQTYFSRNDHNLEEVDSLLHKFWENENVISVESAPWKMEDQLALKKVEQSLKYENGKYQVVIPWKNNEPTLFNNHDMAFQRLQNTDKTLTKNVELEGIYSDIIDQYIQKGYIRKVEEEEKRPHKAWYLPHFPVLRPDKPTTKTRIVFDASAKENGVSLNDEIHQGPKLQRDLFNILIRF